jgi:hypothetical protein
MPAVAVDFGQILVCGVFAMVAAIFRIPRHRANTHIVPAFAVIIVRHNLEKPPLFVNIGCF